MANNEEILNELFFKKKNKGYSESLKDKQAQYKPVSKTADIKSLFNGNSVDGFVVSDTDEVKKRIVGALGMAMGNNTIKSMAHKAIKSFPIIVSDDVAPETLVMIKTMMEEQYASYIDLLVSNQIINLTDYEVGDEHGNIAIQALNKIDGTDFGTTRIARQAQTGSLSIDDIMKNNPGWAFIRANEGLTSGNPILDTLMENAIIVPSEYSNDVVETMLDEEYLEERVSGVFRSGYLDRKGSAYEGLTDAAIEKGIRRADKSYVKVSEYGQGDKFYDQENDRTYIRTDKDEWVEFTRDSKDDSDPIRKIDIALDNIRVANATNMYKDYGFDVKKNDHKEWETRFNKLITPKALVNKDDLERSLDRSVAEIISGKNATNKKEQEMAAYIKDRFEKASYLLVSSRISGAEYVCYLVDRLGIPVSNTVRTELILKFKTKDITFKGTKMWDIKKDSVKSATTPEVEAIRASIDKNERYLLNKAIPQICGISGKDVLVVTGGGAVGASAGLGAAAAVGAAVAAPFLWIPLTGALIGAGTAAIVRYFINKKKTKEIASSIEGWERVEALIDEMDESRNELYNHMISHSKMSDLADDEDKMRRFREEDNKMYNDFTTKLGKVLNTVVVNEGITDLRGYMQNANYSNEKMESALATIEELDEAFKADEDAYSEFIMMNESAKYIINTKKPGDIIIKQTKLKSKEFSPIPLFGTKDVVAYGSVEYDKRELKDRKYNEPLILTIKFKERYSDGKYNDNELTAVIGILGVITRVPSDEMAYILKENAEGKTIKNLFGSDSANNSKELIGNVISNFMNTKHAEKLPTSGKVWANLEKVSALAVANKLSGANNGNISNAHLVFSQREIDLVKNELGVDYLKNAKLTAQLMKKYAAFMIMVCNDALQYVYSYSDPDAISWDDAPYSAYMGKSNSDQLLSAFTQYNRLKL